MNQRVNTVCDLLIKCWNRREIHRYGAEKWDLKERAVDTLLERARARLKEDADVDRTDMLAARIHTLETIIKKHMETNPSAAVGALKLLDNLVGFGVNPNQPKE